MSAPDPSKIRISEIMTKAVLTVDIDTIIFDAVEQMVLKNVGALVVTKNDEVVGMVTERDLLKRVIMGGLQSRHESVRLIYTPHLVTISPDITVEAMCRQMAEGHFRHLPIMTDGKLLGLVSATDLIRFIAGE